MRHLRATLCEPTSQNGDLPISLLLPLDDGIEKNSSYSSLWNLISELF